MKIIKIGLIIFSAAFLFGCIGQSNTYSSVGYNSTFEKTPEYTSNLRIRNSEEPIRFQGILFLEKGSCSIRITKPDGEIAKEYNFSTPGEKNLIAQFKAIDGRWNLEMESNDAQGSYRFQWSNKKEES